jgi:hypothetical protein
VCVCVDGKQLCGNSCVDTQTDPANCGACDNQCATDQTCEDGLCVGGTTGGGGGGGTTGDGGSGGTAGDAGSGGTTGGGGSGTGGATGGSGGSSGSAGAGACSHTPPPDERITDFSIWDDGNWGDPGTTLNGGSYKYGAAGYSLQMVVQSAVLTVTGTVPADGYAGFGLWFAPCVDASAYRGLSFRIGGDAGGTLVVLQVQTSKNYPTAEEDDRGECTGTWDDGCANNEVVIDVPATPATVEVEWGELSGGEPEDTVTASELLGLQWQFNCGEAACSFRITLDDIVLFE